MLAGGVLGIGGSYHPLPWRLVRYAPSHGGFILEVEKTVLNGGPAFKSAGDASFDAAYVARIDSYYSVAGLADRSRRKQVLPICLPCVTTNWEDPNWADRQSSNAPSNLPGSVNSRLW